MSSPQVALPLMSGIRTVTPAVSYTPSYTSAAARAPTQNPAVLTSIMGETLAVKKPPMAAVAPRITPLLAPRLYNTLTGDDVPTIVKTVLTWAPTVPSMLRVSTIGEGNCAFHGVLKASSDVYRKERTAQGRTRIAQQFRRELATDLDKNFEKYDKALDFTKIGYSKCELVDHLASNNSVGDEVFHVTAVNTDLNIHVANLYANGHYDPLVVYKGSKKGRNVIIIQVSGHYELIVRQSGTGYQTIFEDSDPALPKYKP